MLGILGICINIEKLSGGKGSTYIQISRWHTFDFGTWSSLIITRWCRWRSRLRWHQLWRRCTCAFTHPACLWILCCAYLAKKATIHLICLNQCRVSLYCSPQFSISHEPNSLMVLFSDFSSWFHDKVLNSLYRAVRNPFFGHFGHVQGRAHVKLF